MKALQKNVAAAIVLLLALMLISNIACAQDTPKFELRANSSIIGFPSASAIVCRGERLYVMGDDSRHMVVLDQRYRKLDSIPVFGGTEKRISQYLKADIESAILIGKKILLIGSGSSPAREQSYLIRLRRNGGKVVKTLDNKSWLNNSDLGIAQINIEGSIVFDDKLICSNRAMKGESKNLLFVVPVKSFLRGRSVKGDIREIIIPDSIRKSAGISDLCYVRSDDLLLVTLSSEDSSNPLEDGAIGTSYIGWIEEFSQRFNGGVLQMDGVADLTSVDPLFDVHKIEGVCAQPGDGNSLILHLASDNDDGKSSIFGVRMIRR